MSFYNSESALTSEWHINNKQMFEKLVFDFILICTGT